MIQFYKLKILTVLLLFSLCIKGESFRKVVSVLPATTSSKMLSNLLNWQPLTVLIFSIFFLGSLLSIFFFLKIMFYGSRLTVINGLYALSFLTMGLVVPSYVRQKKHFSLTIDLPLRVFFFMKLEL